MQQLPGLFHPMYDGVEQPVLFLQNGKIAACNPAAQRLQLQPGDEARALLPPELSFEQLLLAPSNVRIHLPDQNIDALTQPVCGGLLIFLPAAAAGSDRIAAALSRAAQAVSSPLTSLLAVTSGIFPLLADAEDPVLQQNLAVLLRACYQLLRVSDNLTGLSSSLQGQLPLALERTDLTDYLDTLCQDAQMLCRQTGRQLDVQLPLAPVYAWVDRRLLQRALLSLLSNAIKFSAPESTIQLVFSRLQARASIRIISAGNMDAAPLFDAFTRYATPPALDDPRFGAGFSLPLARAIAQAHGGSVLLQSQPGTGTEVLLSLPLTKPDDETLLRSPQVHIDRSGGFVPELVELSDVLPAAVFDIHNFL